MYQAKGAWNDRVGDSSNEQANHSLKSNLTATFVGSHLKKPTQAQIFNHQQLFVHSYPKNKKAAISSREEFATFLSRSPKLIPHDDFLS